ncbi:hypothetical protein [Methanobacterium sp.]|uniref:hypothetical protein n=1 Tax=Methanobacterium sp. TaxID=2164 RepID=UPI0031580AF1
MELEFNEPVTFDAPNIEGKQIRYVVLPMQVEYIPKLLEFVDLEQAKKEYENKLKSEANKAQVKNSKSRKGIEKEEVEIKPFEFDEKIGELVRFIIDKAVKSVETNDVLPDYNRKPTVVMQLVNKIIELTGIADGEGDGTPLNIPKTTS